MIVAYQPGGTVRDARVVLKPDEKLPNRYNIPETIVYREEAAYGFRWELVKARFSVLPADSPLLSQPALPEVEIPLTTGEGDTFDHADIIRMEDDDQR